jgi:hypothetical protein
LINSELEWEYANPTYEELFPEGWVKGNEGVVKITAVSNKSMDARRN